MLLGLIEQAGALRADQIENVDVSIPEKLQNGTYPDRLYMGVPPAHMQKYLIIRSSKFKSKYQIEQMELLHMPENTLKWRI